METDVEIPDFPFFEIDDTEAAFGCRADRYVGRGDYDEGKRRGYRAEKALREETEAASSLFFVGGRLSDFGFTPKKEFGPAVNKTLIGLLRSFAPSHEEKIGTVALAIHHWCDRIEQPA